MIKLTSLKSQSVKFESTYLRFWHLTCSFFHFLLALFDFIYFLDKYLISNQLVRIKILNFQ